MPLNVQALRTLANAIEQSGRFDLNVFMRQPQEGSRGFFRVDTSCDANDLLTDCGSVGCLAGWQNALAGRSNPTALYDAGRDLGLNNEQSDELFTPDALGDSIWLRFDSQLEDPYDATAEQAVGLLRALADGTITFPSWDDDGESN